ncbi:hypothetical protein C8R47DRAFT_1074431 [Mycena vitilis]|nr:hypothetical protein C8R47DRAFT_1074431 [Mycena vitilis]
MGQLPESAWLRPSASPLRSFASPLVPNCQRHSRVDQQGREAPRNPGRCTRMCTLPTLLPLLCNTVYKATTLASTDKSGYPTRNSIPMYFISTIWLPLLGCVVYGVLSVPSPSAAQRLRNYWPSHFLFSRVERMPAFFWRGVRLVEVGLEFARWTAPTHVLRARAETTGIMGSYLDYAPPMHRGPRCDSAIPAPLFKGLSGPARPPQDAVSPQQDLAAHYQLLIANASPALPTGPNFLVAVFCYNPPVPYQGRTSVLAITGNRGRWVRPQRLAYLKAPPTVTRVPRAASDRAASGVVLSFLAHVKTQYHLPLQHPSSPHPGVHPDLGGSRAHTDIRTQTVQVAMAIRACSPSASSLQGLSLHVSYFARHSRRQLRGMNSGDTIVFHSPKRPAAAPGA